MSLHDPAGFEQYHTGCLQTLYFPVSSEGNCMMVDQSSSSQNEYVGIASALFIIMFYTDSVLLRFHKLSRLLISYLIGNKKPRRCCRGVFYIIRLHLFKSIKSPAAGKVSLKTVPIDCFDMYLLAQHVSKIQDANLKHFS